MARERGSSIAGKQAQKRGGWAGGGVTGKSGGLDWGRGRGPSGHPGRLSYREQHEGEGGLG